MYKPKQRHVQVELWTINRWLRWAGLRLFVNLPDKPGIDPTGIGILWAGLPGSAGWHRWEGTPRRAPYVKNTVPLPDPPPRDGGA